MHENYYPGDENTLPRHDIAILVLDKPVDFLKYSVEKSAGSS